MKEDASSLGIKDFPSLYLIENDGKFVQLARLVDVHMKSLILFGGV